MSKLWWSEGIEVMTRVVHGPNHLLTPFEPRLETHMADAILFVIWWQWCWWLNFDVGDIFSMLVSDANLKRKLVLGAKMAKTVSNIFELSPTHFVSNIDVTGGALELLSFTIWAHWSIWLKETRNSCKFITVTFSMAEGDSYRPISIFIRNRYE